MNIVLDTNVLVAGLLSPYGSCAGIVRMVSSGEITLLYDARILTEYREVLARPKFHFSPDQTEAILDYIQFKGIPIASSPLPRPLPDPDDHPFIEVALKGEATCLVTGNKSHFPIKQCQGMKCFSPTEFLAFYRQR